MVRVVRGKLLGTARKSLTGVAVDTCVDFGVIYAWQLLN